MTTGAYGTFGAPTGGFEGTRSGASWSGDNGKYEATSTGIRSKWNNYDARRCSLNASSSVYGWACPLGHTYFTDAELPYYGNMGDLSLTSSEIILLYNKLLSKIKGSSFNAAVNIAQTKELADMVVSNAGKLGRAIQALKHGDFYMAASQLGAPPRTSQLRPSDVAGRWLELQYGWMPTIQDTYEGFKLYEHLTNGPAATRFRVSKSNRSPRIFSSISYGGNTARVDRDYGRYVVAEIFEDMSSLRQSGLLDPLSVAWEVLPYSFVADWFVPIGAYLEDLNQIPSLSGRFLITDFTRARGVSFRWDGSPMPFCPIHLRQFSGIVQSPSSKYMETYIHRTVASSLEFDPPSVDLSLGRIHGARVGNAISLLSQRFHQDSF